MLEELLGRVARFGRVEPWWRLRGFVRGLLADLLRETVGRSCRFMGALWW